MDDDGIDDDKSDGNRGGFRGYENAEIGAIAHLYRGEVYRSTLWRTRLDTTTNWSVVTLGIAVSVSFASPNASPVPLLLVGVLILFFLVLEARRYRYFNVWRARARWMESNFYAPMLTDGKVALDGWEQTLAKDYRAPEYHITMMQAVGRRLRRNYIWILLVQSLSYYGKIIVHPTEISNLGQIVERSQIGPVPGEAMIILGVLYNIGWLGLAIYTYQLDRAVHRSRQSSSAMG